MSHSPRSRSAPRMLKKEFSFWVAVFFLAVFFSVGNDMSQPFQSSEIKFAFSSESGLPIVPASCESGVSHYSFVYNSVSTTECSCPAGTTFSSSPSPTCVPNIPGPVTNFSGSSPSPGTTATLTWSAVSGATYYAVRADSAPNSWSGTCTTINPGDQCLNVNGTSHAWSTTAGCSYTAWVHACNASGCGTQSTLSFTCTAPSCTGTVPLNATLCANDCSGLSADTPRTVVTACGAPKGEYTCDTGYAKSGNTCPACTVGSQCQCSAGQLWSGSSCVSCSVGQQCWCPAGQHWNGSACQANCVDSYFCQGNNLMHQDTSCNSTVSLICSYGCSAGACIVPDPEITLSVTPLLLQKGETAQVVWSTNDMSSCTVTSTNGASWSGLSGSQTSPAIQMQTIITVRCTSVLDTTISQSATVNIIPIFCEPGNPQC